MVEWVRVNGAHPCPICGRDHFCSVSADGGLVYCTRIESHTRGADGVGWIHKIKNGWRVNGGNKIVQTNGTGARSTTRYAIVGADGVLAAVHCRVDLASGGKRIWWTLPDGT